MLNDPESAICSFRDPSFRVGVQFVLWWPNFDIHSASRILMVLGLEETRMRSSFLSSWLSRPQIPCRSKHVLCVFPYSGSTHLLQSSRASVPGRPIMEAAGLVVASHPLVSLQDGSEARALCIPVMRRQGGFLLALPSGCLSAQALADGLESPLDAVWPIYHLDGASSGGTRRWVRGGRRRAHRAGGSGSHGHCCSLLTIQ